jgi:flagellar basal-body rod modification protein FlgD
MAVSATSGASNASNASNTASAPVVDQAKTGFNALDAEAFMKMLITQLQNQDPLEPTGNDELLNQISQMRSLQSNIELSETLGAITTSQQLSTAASYIGKTVTATLTTDDGAQEVSGVVDRAFLADGKGYVGIGDAAIPLSDVHGVSA